MSASDFSATQCPKCYRPIWSGLGYSMISLKLDTDRLNLKDEILAKLDGLRTYEIHRTATSFEVTPRSMGYLTARNPYVLAEHKCKAVVLFGELASDPWGRGKKETIETMEAPF